MKTQILLGLSFISAHCALAQSAVSLEVIAQGVKSREVRTGAVVADVQAQEVWWTTPPARKSFKWGVSGSKTFRVETLVDPRTIEGQRFPGEATVQVFDGMQEQTVYFPAEGDQGKHVRADIGKGAAFNINNPNPGQGTLKIGKWWISELVANGADIRAQVLKRSSSFGKLIRLKGFDPSGKAFVLDLAPDRSWLGVHAEFSEFGYKVETTVDSVTRAGPIWLPAGMQITIRTRQPQGDRQDVSSIMRVTYVPSAKIDKGLFEFRSLPVGSPVRNVATGINYIIGNYGQLERARTHGNRLILMVAGIAVLCIVGPLLSRIVPSTYRR